MIIWSLELLFYGAQFLETDNTVLIVCTFTMVTGLYSFYILCCKWLFFGLSSIIFYFIAILFVKTRQNKIFVVTGMTTTPSSLEKKLQSFVIYSNEHNSTIDVGIRLHHFDVDHRGARTRYSSNILLNKKSENFDIDNNFLE
uniref:Uncharacterized protein n=1 Tax=Romanomermis culicivorax TaxID=13658 RepID=A0A915LBS8_ROMCU